MKEEIIYFNNDKEFDEWSKDQHKFLELIKSTKKNKKSLIIQIGKEIYLKHNPE